MPEASYELGLGEYNTLHCFLLQLLTLQQNFDLHFFIICKFDKQLKHNLFSFTNFKLPSTSKAIS